MIIIEPLVKNRWYTTPSNHPTHHEIVFDQATSTTTERGAGWPLSAQIRCTLGGEKLDYLWCMLNRKSPRSDYGPRMLINYIGNYISFAFVPNYDNNSCSSSNVERVLPPVFVPISRLCTRSCASRCHGWHRCCSNIQKPMLHGLLVEVAGTFPWVSGAENTPRKNQGPCKPGACMYETTGG